MNIFNANDKENKQEDPFSSIKIYDPKKIPSIKFYDPQTAIAEKFDFFIKIVLGILIVGFVTMMIMVGALIIDTFHFNSATYREYSDKIDIRNELLEANKALLETNIENQKLINELLKKVDTLTQNLQSITK